MPEPTAAQKLSDFAKRVADSLNNSRAGQWLDKHRDTSLQPETEQFRGNLGRVSQKVATTGNAVSPEVMMAVRNAANKLADTKPVAAAPGTYALPPTKVAEYAVRSIPDSRAPVIELDQPDELDRMRASRDMLGGVQQKAEMDELRKRLAIQALTKQ